MKTIIAAFLFLVSASMINGYGSTKSPVRVLIVTGNHVYNKETFNAMFDSFGKSITYQVVEFPEAFDMFLPANRSKYDVLVLYHMWQTITEEQKNMFAGCIREGKPVVVLHHSICAFDDWEEYWNIIGGKYFHKPTVIGGKEYPACSFKNNIHFTSNIADKKNPVTRGVKDFELFDEIYKGYWVDPSAHILITTKDDRSAPVIGWSKMYGKSRIVTLQSGHDTPTYQNPAFRRLLIQSIRWVFQGIKS
jgi:uncharacterized protein